MNFLSYRITHKTVYAYGDTISEGAHLVKLRPRTTRNQQCQQFQLSVLPQCTVGTEFKDYFGNHCHHLTIDRPHDHLAVTAESKVTVSLPYWTDPEETPAWESVKAQMASDRGLQTLEAIEFTYDSPLIRPNKAIAAFAMQSFSPARPILAAAKELTERIFNEFTFDPVATEIATPVSEVMEHRKGVCQDFAQLAIACFRCMGLPAQYISGYLETQPPPGVTKLVGADASHAWLAFYCPGIGWTELDPTNGCIPALNHIKIGWGRDYTDIAPMVGVIRGADQHTFDVSVDVIAEPASISCAGLNQQ